MITATIIYYIHVLAYYIQIDTSYRYHLLFLNYIYNQIYGGMIYVE